MSEANKSFKEMIIKNLTANDYPTKKVSLPLEKMYEMADDRGANLNYILDELSAEGTAHEKSGEKIIFFAQRPAHMSKEDLMSQAQEMMSKMSPEEMQRIQDMVANMSPEQQQEMMKKAQEMGLF